MTKRFLFSILLVLLLTACSNQETAKEEKEELTTKAEEQVKEQETPKEKEESKFTYNPEEFNRELTEMEKMLMRQPGAFSGDNYDEEQVNRELDQLPDNLTEEEYLEEFLDLLAEDYHDEVKTFVNFDSSVDVDIARPDEEINAPEAKKVHFSILVDASGSMRGKASGKMKMDAAKEAIGEFASNIPPGATMSLRVYGHKGSNQEQDKALSCESSERYFSGTYDKTAFGEALGKVQPAGWTPIALALQSVKQDIPEGTDETIVYVVSDGIETCGGDPVQAAKQLSGDSIKTVVNIIGFDVDQEGQSLLKNVAEAGNGTFTYVNSEQQMKDYLRKQYEQLQQAWFEWKEAGKEQAFAIKEEKKKSAQDTKESMKEKVNQEKERMKKAQEYVKEKYKEDYDHPVRGTFSLIIDRQSEIFRYAVDTGNGLFREAVNNGNDQFREYVDDGNEKIRETIDKKNNQ